VPQEEGAAGGARYRLDTSSIQPAAA
jgi:hypothetical protein